MASAREFRRRAREENDGRKGLGVRYSAGLRGLAVGYARKALAEGESKASVCRGLEITPATLERWLCETEPDEEKGGFLAVEVIDDVEPEAAPSGSISVVTPSGLRIEGLSLDQAGELVRALS